MPLPLAAWETFYVIAGSSGAVLTGLVFVVVSLAAERVDTTSTDGFGAFSTPTVTHFVAVLLLAAIMTVPVQTIVSLAICLGGCAVAGIFASTLAGLRMRRLRSYSAGADDWTWHVILPFITYVILLAMALLLAKAETFALVGVAAAAMALLAIGIHNAWDVAVFLVASDLPRSRGPDAASASASAAPEHPPAATSVTQAADSPLPGGD